MDKATKEKILEMAALCEGCLEKSYADDGCYSCENRGTYYGALKMAEWKQQQMIDKTIEFIYHKMNDTNELDVHNIEKLINDYKEAMREE